MKKLLVITAVSTLTLAFAAVPAAYAEDVPTDDSQMMTTTMAPDDSQAADSGATMSSGTNASNQLQPAGTGTDPVPDVAQMDAAAYDQIRADAAPLANHMSPEKEQQSPWLTIGAFLAGLVLGGLLLMTWQKQRLAKPTPATPTKTKPAKG